jgi:amidase
MPKPLVFVLTSLCLVSRAAAQVPALSEAEIDRDLFEVTIPQLEGFYASQKYTVTQVVEWHLARIHRYNGIYHAVETVMEKEAMVAAAQEDATPAAERHGLLWGVPVVIKANTSIAGQITTDGWAGYTIPGHELIAPRDATVVARLRAAGAILIGHTNLPDFAASDTTRSSSFGRTGNAYDVRFSPGGSSGGAVTAVTSGMAVLGTGTDTSNSIRMPSATSAVIGVLPTRGLVSIAGIAPLDWLLDDTGPIARNVTDAAISLSVMAGEGPGGMPLPDPLDPRTADSATLSQRGPYTQYLKAGALKGKRFGVPAFIVKSAVPNTSANQEEEEPLRPETRAIFMKAIEELRELGATVVFDSTILPESFAKIARSVVTYPYVREGTEGFLKNFGPAQYHSAAEYAKAVGSPLPPVIVGGWPGEARKGDVPVSQLSVESDPKAEANFYGPRRRLLVAYLEPLDRLHLDGYVYPAAQMPPPDETMPQNVRLSSGPHSATGWVNIIGVPAVVVVGGFYPGGLPFGMEFSARPWKDGDLLGYAYDWERATHHRHPPVLVESGLLPDAP